MKRLGSYITNFKDENLIQKCIEFFSKGCDSYLITISNDDNYMGKGHTYEEKGYNVKLPFAVNKEAYFFSINFESMLCSDKEISISSTGCTIIEFTTDEA